MLEKYWKDLQNNYRQSLFRILAVGISLFVISGFVWWHQVYTNPDRVFWGMVNNNLQTGGITRSIRQEAETSTFSQWSHLNFGNQGNLHSKTTFTQLASNGETSVTTETIDTLHAGFVRYTEIHTPEKSKNGEQLDTSKLTNVWSRQELAAVDSNHPFVRETMFGGMLFGDLPQVPRQQITRYLREQNIYDIDYQNVRRHQEDGRPVYTYPVIIDTPAYIRVIREYAKLLQLTSIESIDPEQYASAPPLRLQVTVDILSHQLKSINFSDENRIEHYHDHGVREELTLPPESISPQELQQRLGELESNLQEQ